MQDHRELKVWQKAHAMTLAVYRVTREFPNQEMYGLTSQIRRAVVSIEANLAEGCGRHGRNELAHFVSIASGSAASGSSWSLVISPWLTTNDQEPRTAFLRRMLNAFHQRLRTNDQ